MPHTKKPSNVRDAGSGKYVKHDQAKTRPKETVTEPQKPQKSQKKGR